MINQNFIDSTHLNFVYKVLAEVYHSNKNYELALEYYEKAIMLSNENSDLFDLYFSIGLLYKDLEQYEKSMNYLLKSKDYFGDDLPNNIHFYYKSLYTVYKKLGHLENALKNYEKYVLFKDSFAKIDGKTV